MRPMFLQGQRSSRPCFRKNKLAAYLPGNTAALQRRGAELLRFVGSCCHASRKHPFSQEIQNYLGGRPKQCFRLHLFRVSAPPRFVCFCAHVFLRHCFWVSVPPLWFSRATAFGFRLHHFRLPAPPVASAYDGRARATAAQT